MDLLGRNINLGDDNEHRYFESKSNAQVLLGHATDAHVGSDDDHAVVWHQTNKAKHRCLQVLLVAAQVKKRHQLLAVRGNVSPRLVLRRVLTLWHNDVLVVETHDFLADAARPSVFDLMAEVEDLLSRRASTIVHDAFGEHADKSRLTRVDVANDGHSDVVLVAGSH